ncbi:hypothetical protein C4571_02170 [Candidatus Parcubacteria bacterium]|nr:MAG: hypothetical protein C4571_02170 [Candidatus Parcubacteria bacterium]
MARVLNEGDQIRIRIETEDDEKRWPVLILTYPNEQELDKHERDRATVEMARHGKVKTKVDYAADIQFIEKHLVGCENIEIPDPANPGQFVPLTTTTPEWKSKIPVRWKRRAINYFLTGDAMGDEDPEKN